jgi:hypothetical protein
MLHFEIERGDPKIHIADAPFKLIFDKTSGLFETFNFTITESTPLDVEVAVDPEMLGRIFEELVTGRHETGSYYTPRAVVSFMCREALKCFLESNVTGEQKETLEKFVEDRKADELLNADLVLDALRRVRVCDPACGSGAYLLGMLHEILDLRAALFQSKSLDAKSVYRRKLEIIQTNLYGVDIDQFAVNIARLRLWLSLAVEFDGVVPEPLPNLDYKVERGDSLIAPLKGAENQASFYAQIVDDYLGLKRKYLTAHGSDKLTLSQQIERMKAEISGWSTQKGKEERGFDWSVEFAEVFIKDGGFDIIVANPPYVRADAQFKHISDEKLRIGEIEHWREYRKRLAASKLYCTLYEKWDLYIPFLERAHQLLRQGGDMEFIIPDAYNTAKYADTSHAFFVSDSVIRRIDFCTDINLFDAGVNNTILSIAKDVPKVGHRPRRVRRFGANSSDFDRNQEGQESIVQSDATADMLFRIAHRTSHSVAIKTVPLSNICYLSWGLRPNADEGVGRGEFTTSDVIADTEDRYHPKKVIQGKDTVKWWPFRIRFLEWGTKRAPARFARPTFPELYSVPEKLLAMKVSGKLPRVVYDDLQLCCTDAFCCCVLWRDLRGVKNRSIRKTIKYRSEASSSAAVPVTTREELEAISDQFSVKYLLGIMNSSVAAEWLNGRRRNKIQLYPEDWKRLPIANVGRDKQREVEKVVTSIVGLFRKNQIPLSEAQQERLAALEAELNHIVVRLYSETGC